MRDPGFSTRWAILTSLAACAAMMALVLLLLLPATQPPSQHRFIALTEIFMCLVACIEIVFGTLWLRDLGHGKAATLAAVLAATCGPLACVFATRSGLDILFAALCVAPALVPPLLVPVFPAVVFGVIGAGTTRRTAPPH
ncbi:MAG: hypothetical protein SFY96_06220 [Planctomycetota bacterium]|nr:hypothetical protein [Planctomycetota bacterium]